MSLARIALRIAAVEAIKGHTLVGSKVLDSPNGALDIAADGTMRTDEDRPFVSVYTDNGTVEGMTGRSLVDNGSCVLVIEAGISMAMTETDEQTGVSQIVGVAIPASDQNFEFFLDLVQRQIIDALSDPDNEWAEIYRGLHYRVTKVEIGGKRNSDDGQRLAGHQTRITVDLIDDPVRGEPIDPGTPLARFFAMLDASADPVYQAQAQAMLDIVGGSDPDWKILQRRHGMTAAELLALGRGPIAQDELRETPEFIVGAVEVDGVGDEREIV
ncbi:hypothetical protein [Aurantimonas aggregata]|uniref:hypothetical protein n=1 Tax=Aurantimonas aggregata TaxID=2047720 RepID=UPI0019413C7F|nr:hypothetical protein [Aurantimonas aggregata]